VLIICHITNVLSILTNPLHNFLKKVIIHGDLIHQLIMAVYISMVVSVPNYVSLDCHDRQSLCNAARFNV